MSSVKAERNCAARDAALDRSNSKSRSRRSAQSEAVEGTRLGDGVATRIEVREMMAIGGFDVGCRLVSTGVAR